MISNWMGVPFSKLKSRSSFAGFRSDRIPTERGSGGGRKFSQRYRASGTTDTLASVLSALESMSWFANSVPIIYRSIILLSFLRIVVCLSRFTAFHGCSPERIFERMHATNSRPPLSVSAPAGYPEKRPPTPWENTSVPRYVRKSLNVQQEVRSSVQNYSL